MPNPHRAAEIIPGAWIACTAPQMDGFMISGGQNPMMSGPFLRVERTTCGTTTGKAGVRIRTETCMGWKVFTVSLPMISGRGGGGGRLYHYDGKTWSLSYSYTIKGMGEPTIKDIWGISPSNIYVTGVALPDKGLPYKSFLLYYNGKQWKEVFVTDFGVQFLRVRSDRSGVYLGGRIVDQGAPDTLVFYRYRGDRLKELLATTKEIQMNTINGSLFFLVNDTLYHSPPDILRDGIPLPTQNVVYDLNGRSVNDLFFYFRGGTGALQRCRHAVSLPHRSPL